MNEPHVINVAVLVTGDTRPKYLSQLLDLAFEDVDEVLQFVVEGYGWEPGAEPTVETMMTSTVEDAAERLTEPSTDAYEPS